MSREQALPVGGGCSNAHLRNPRRSEIPLFEEMSYAAMIGQSAIIHVVESLGTGNFTANKGDNEEA